MDTRNPERVHNLKGRNPGPVERKVVIAGDNYRLDIGPGKPLKPLCELVLFGRRRMAPVERVARHEDDVNLSGDSRIDDEVERPHHVFKPRVQLRCRVNSAVRCKAGMYIGNVYEFLPHTCMTSTVEPFSDSFTTSILTGNRSRRSSICVMARTLSKLSLTVFIA